ncbi:protein ARV1-like [Corticium candelabrum]|uniref:protein ARV1-like n=1 Tax=Corticium candelabrum TaxID=121492 RepID=UPI002E25FB2E|nr:protein ARV1-like [Corticium candelabrum]
MAEPETVCVCCGYESSVYTEFSEGVIRLNRCERCKSVVDRYVECDVIVLLLDILLHKSEAFRHLLFNRKISLSSQLKFWFVCIICTTYVKWNKVNNANNWKLLGILPESMSVPEVYFLVLAFHSASEAVTFVFGASVAVWIFQFGHSKVSEHPLGWIGYTKCFFVISYGRILVMPLALWARSSLSFYTWLPLALVFTSTLQAVRVLGCANSSLFAVIPPCLGLISQLISSTLITMMTGL